MFVCAVALAFVTWRFILPLAAQYLTGVGVEIPLPKRFVMAHPKLAVWIYLYWAARFSSFRSLSLSSGCYAWA